MPEPDRTTWRNHLVIFILFVALTLLIPSFVFAEDAKQLPDPDRKPADMSKPAQVYILLVG